MKISAVMLMMWYCLSIIGFGTHTCNRSGHTSIATFVEETDCCHHHEKEHDVEFGVSDCCTSDYHMILLSGCRICDNSDERNFSVGPLYPESLPSVSTILASVQYHAEHLQFLDPDSRGVWTDDVYALYGVYRI